MPQVKIFKNCISQMFSFSEMTHLDVVTHTVSVLLLLLLLSGFSRVGLCATPQTAAHQIPHSWESPGKNTGVGCHCLLQFSVLTGVFTLFLL